MSVTMTVRMSESEKALVSDYSRVLGVTTSQFVRDCVLERIEDELDLKAYEQAKAAYDADPVSYTIAETERLLGL